MAREPQSGNQVVQMDLTAQVKRSLADPGGRIALHDLVVRELKRVVELISDENFPVQGCAYSREEATARVARYEEATEELRQAVACMAYWGDEAHRNVLALAHSRLCDNFENRQGTVGWLALRPYPLVLALYSAGVAATAARNFGNLAAVFSASVVDPDDSQEPVPLVDAVGSALIQMERAKTFSALPGHDRDRTPRSEYLFDLLRPELDELLFLGRNYEACFAEFEVLLALACGCFRKRAMGYLSAPIGRFARKARRDHGDNPLRRVLAEAEARRSEWPPLRTGLLPVGYDQFKEVADELVREIGQLQWW